MDDDRQEGVELPSELEFGDETGDHRENDPGSPGYTPADDRVFRSRFQRANRLADRDQEQGEPANTLARDAAGDSERGRTLGAARADTAIGTTPSHDRSSFCDPVPGNIDPTDPESPEQTFDWQHGSDLSARPPAKEDRSRKPADMPSDVERRLE